MPPTSLPAPGPLTLEQRIQNLESLASVNNIGVTPTTIFNANGEVTPPLLEWNGSPPIVALQQTTAGAYTLPDPGEYEGVTMTVVAIPVPDWFAESHILTGRFVVDGVPNLPATSKVGMGRPSRSPQSKAKAGSSCKVTVWRFRSA